MRTLYQWPYPYHIITNASSSCIPQRAASSERVAEQLKSHLDSATQNLHQAEQMQQAPDMEQAIDILKRSSLEVELAAKEKEVSLLCFSLISHVY